MRAVGGARLFAAVGQEYLQAVFDLISFRDLLTGGSDIGEWNAEHSMSALSQLARFWATRNWRLVAAMFQYDDPDHRKHFEACVNADAEPWAAAYRSERAHGSFPHMSSI